MPVNRALCVHGGFKLRRVIEFNKKRFWIGDVNLDLLNEQILEIENDGWKIIPITPNSSLFGYVVSYTLLIETN